MVAQEKGEKEIFPFFLVPNPKHPPCPLSQLKTIRGGLPPSTRGGKTYHWHSAAPTLFVIALTTTCTIHLQDLTLGLAPWRHPSMQPHFTPTCSPPAQLHLIAISILAINSLSRACYWSLPRQPLRIERPSTSTQPTPLTPAHTQPPHASARYTQEPWLNPLPPLTKVRLSVRRAQTPHRLASRWCPFSIHSSNGLGCIVSIYVWHDTCNT